jgi:hypothetical protein
VHGRSWLVERSVRSIPLTNETSTPQIVARLPCQLGVRFPAAGCRLVSVRRRLVVMGTTSVGHVFDFLEGRLALSERKLEAITGL